MIESTLPATGLTLLRDRPSSRHSGHPRPRQLIQLDLNDIVVNDVLKSIRNNETVRLHLGKKPAIQYAKRSIPLSHHSDTYPSEIFSGPRDGSSPLYFSGKLSHTLEVQKAKEDTARADEALAALESTLKTIQEQKASNEANLVKSKGPGKKDIKPIVVAGRDRLLRSNPASPFLTPGRSPGLAPSSAPLLSTAPSKDKIRQDAMRIPIVHLLAIQPMTAGNVAETLNVSPRECGKVLDRVSREVNGKRELKDKVYRELDVWKFPYKTSEDREQAINHAVHAYDRTRLERNDPLWQQLLPKHERGKGKVLSRLKNFDKPIVPPKPVMPAEKEVKGDVSDREERVRKPKVVKEAAPKKKAQNDDGEAKMTKSTAKLLAKLAKKESKYKSSERIEDSDEEAEEGARNGAKPAPPTVKGRDREAEKPAVRPAANKVSLHKSRLSDSSVSSADGRGTAKPAERERLKPRPRAEATNSKVSPRARTNSSPQKPSPLGSSPPTNSTDLEESSKGSTQSSAPSSPPSSNDAPLAQHRRHYSPVENGKSRELTKRKPERNEDEPPAKKQQLNGDRLNALPKSLTSQLQHPTPERRSSASTASSPEKSKITKQDVIANAKVFTSYYGKYRDLHERLSRLPSKDREDKEIDKLWTMHKRLGEMKVEIWDDWARVGGGD